MKISRRLQPMPKKDNEGWIYSYADLMSLLMGFFVILYSFSTLDPRKMAEISQQIADAFSGKRKTPFSENRSSQEVDKRLAALSYLSQFVGLSADIDQAIAEVEYLKTLEQVDRSEYIAMRERVKSRLKKLGASIQGDLEKRSLSVHIANYVLFKSGSAQLNHASVAYLKNLFNKTIQANEIERIQIIGHSDSRGSYTSFSNHTLALQRSESVAKLIQKQFPHIPIELVAKGANEPLYPEKDEKGHWIKENLQKNRRVEIRFIRKPLATRLLNEVQK